MKHKKLLIAFTAIFTLVVAFSVFLMIWFWADTYPDFEEFTSGVAIPGLGEGAVPQGLANASSSYTVTDDEGNETSGTQEYFFVSAYMKSGPSRIYVTGEKTGYVGFVTLVNDGKEFKGHCGGIATNGTTLWVASDSTVYVAKASSTAYSNIVTEIIVKAQANTKYLNEETESTEGLQSVSFTASFAANCNASFCYFFDATGTDKLYVGEFYRKGNYETDERHRVTTPAGDFNTAFVYEYNVNSSTSNPYGLTTLSDSSLSEEMRVPKIQYIYSVPGLVQGFARTRDGSLVLSLSYGLDPSHLLYYDWSAVTSSSTTYKKVTGNNFTYAEIKTNNNNNYTANPTLYYVDSTSLLRDYTLPSMTEGLCVSGTNTVHVLFESGCYKYKMFVRQIMNNIFSFVPKKKG